MSLFLFNGFSSNSSSVFTTNRIQSIRVNPISASLIPARDRPIDFGKHKGRPLGTLPSKYLKWVSKNLRARDFEDWAKLADEVLEDPVYKDRLEWELAEQILSGDSGAGRGGESPVSNLVELSERFGWDNEDELGWSRVDFELLGTSKGGRIPRRRGGFKGTQSEKLVPLRGKIGFFNKSRSGVGGEEKRVVSVGGKREERIERQKLRRRGVSKVGLGIGGKNEEIVVNQDEGQLSDQEEMMKKKPLNKFPGRESLIRKSLNRRGL